MGLMIQKGILVPALFALLFVIIIGAYAALFFVLPIPQMLKVFIALGSGMIVVAMGYVVIERNREMEDEGKDDLSKY